MTVNAPNHPELLTGGAHLSGRPSASQGAQGFTSLLTRASSAATTAGKSRESQLRETIEQFVSSAFMMPLMNELREQPLDSDLFGGGFAQDSFQQQLDTILADRIVAGGNFPIVDSIYQRVMANASAQPQPAAVDIAA